MAWILTRNQWGLDSVTKVLVFTPGSREPSLRSERRRRFCKTRGMEKAWEQIRCFVSKPARVCLTRSRVQGHKRSESTKRHGSRPSYWSKSPWTCVEPSAGIGRSVGAEVGFLSQRTTLLCSPNPTAGLIGRVSTDEYKFNLKFLGLSLFATPS